jgi:hypothetical protein
MYKVQTCKAMFSLPQKLGANAMEEIEVVLRKFGDEQSTLLDRFERLSFEVQLSRAILGRSLSSPSGGRFGEPLIGPAPTPPLVMQVQEGSRGLGFHKSLKKLLKPFLVERVVVVVVERGKSQIQEIPSLGSLLAGHYRFDLKCLTIFEGILIHIFLEVPQTNWCYSSSFHLVL